MFSILQFLRGDTPSGPGKWDRSPGMMLVAALAGVAGVCCMACMAAQDAWDAAYRMAWVLLDAVSLLVFCAVFRSFLQLNLRSTLLIVVMLLLQLLIMVGIGSLRGGVAGYAHAGQTLLWLPYMLAPMAVSVMSGHRLGLVTAWCASLFGMALFPAGEDTALMLVYGVVGMVSGMLAALMTGRAHKREQVLRAGLATGAATFASVFILVALRQYMHPQQGVALAGISAQGFNTSAFAMELGVTAGLNFILAALVGGLIPALERLFNITTPITWLEWADMNHPLLKKLQMAAPGTFHHCLVVQRLAEAGAEAIGADVTRAGVCALYHDIGKINKPDYFSENIPDQSRSPHRELTPEASVRIITAHVTDGVALANQYGLNSRIVSVIREHHGVGTAFFFYNKARDQYEQEKRKYEEGQIDTCPDPVDVAQFSYKGPIPQTRESGIISLADATESATRSLVNPTEEDVRAMIDSIFKGRILDGHLRDCQLTLGDLEKLKETFFVHIRTMHHSRIAYPKPDADAAAELVERRKKQL